VKSCARWVGLRDLLVLLVIGLAAAHGAAQPCDDLLIHAPDPIAGELFGRSMAIDGTTLVVGAAGRALGEGTIRGRAFIFEWDHGAWQYVATLSSRDSQPGDAFGHSVAISHGLIAVGSPCAANPDGIATGVVSLFARPLWGWRTTDHPIAVLEPSHGADGDQFGSAVGISDGWIMVGSPFADPGRIDAGEVRAFGFSWGQWIERATLANPNPLANEHFGLRLVLDGDMLVVSAPNLLTHTLPGSVHVFARNDRTGHWIHTQAIDGGADRKAGDHFGRSLVLQRSAELEGNLLLVGSTGDDPHGEHSGSAHLFRLAPTGQSEFQWLRAQIVAPENGRVGDHFGFACALDGNLMLVTAMFASPGGVLNAGKTYAYGSGDESIAVRSYGEIASDCPRLWDNLGISCAFFHNEFGALRGALLGVPGADPDGVLDAGAVRVVLTQ